MQSMAALAMRAAFDRLRNDIAGEQSNECAADLSAVHDESAADFVEAERIGSGHCRKHPPFGYRNAERLEMLRHQRAFDDADDAAKDEGREIEHAETFAFGAYVIPGSGLGLSRPPHLFLW